MLENGIATWADFPYSEDVTIPKNYLEWSTDKKVWKNANNYKIDKVGAVKVTDGTNTPVISPDSSALNDIKQLLNNGYVLNCSTEIYSWKYKTIKDNPSTDADNGFVGKSAAFMQDGYVGGHSMTVVGYSDNIWVDINDNNVVDPGENGAFRIANSWGDTWQDNGFSWIAYDALNKVSAVSGAPAASERNSIWGDENAVFWLTAKSSYTPGLIGEITLNHAKRNQVKLELGMQEADGTDTVTLKPIAVNYNSYTEVAFDGTDFPCDATFAFDYSDMFKGKDISGVTKNWTIKVTDTSLDGNGALVKSFKVIDPLSGNTASCSQVNQTVDGTSMLFSSPLTLTSNTPTESEWVFKNSMPFGMRIEKAYQFDDKIYAVGYSCDKGSDGLICYDPISEQVEWIHSIGSYYDWDLSVGYDNKIYLFGDSNVKVYDINTGIMSSKSIIPSRKGMAPIVELNGKIYIINGYLTDNDGKWTTLTKGVMVYDTATDTWDSTTDTNIARRLPGAVALNGKIYLFGGYDTERNVYESIEEYDPAANQWTLIANYLPCPIDSKFLSMGDKIYSLGTDNINQVFEYNPDLNQWNKHCNIPEAYFSIQAESLNGKIYVMAGKMTYSGSYSPNVLEFTPSVSEVVVSAPAFSIKGGTHKSIQSITLSCATEGATIRYTTDGSIPTSTSEIYTGPITIAGSKIIKAYAQKVGMTDSNVSVSSYVLSIQVGDVNGDGIVDVFDYPLLVKYANGTINDFPVEDDLWAGDLDGDGIINNTDVSLMQQRIFGEISFFPKEQVKAPSFGLAEGTYTSFQSITLNCATIGATIRYTTDGSIPTSDSQIYTGCFNITKSTTVKAFAQKAGLHDSDITSATYTLSIKIGDVDGNGFIDTFDYLLMLKYANGTIDDFPVEDDLWIGDLDGDGLINNTDVSLMRQKIFGEIGFFPKEQVKAPSFSLAEGTYSSTQAVTLQSATEGAIIRYTTDGTMPSSTSELYTGPITVSNSETIKAYASKEGMVDSDIASATYTIISKVENPVISPAGGTYTSIQTVTLNCATEGAAIRYTTDGTTPTSTSPVYTGPITVASSKTIKAYASKEGMVDSEISTAEYQLAIGVGDVNGDGNVDAIDYALLKIYLENPPYDFPVDDDMWAGDLNGDGSIDAIDLFLMKQFINGQIAYFPKSR
jgi:hypothetical protein